VVQGKDKVIHLRPARITTDSSSMREGLRAFNSPEFMNAHGPYRNIEIEQIATVNRNTLAAMTNWI